MKRIIVDSEDNTCEERFLRKNLGIIICGVIFVILAVRALTLFPVVSADSNGNVSYVVESRLFFEPSDYSSYLLILSSVLFIILLVVTLYDHQLSVFCFSLFFCLSVAVIFTMFNMKANLYSNTIDYLYGKNSEKSDEVSVEEYFDSLKIKKFLTQFPSYNASLNSDTGSMLLKEESFGGKDNFPSGFILQVVEVEGKPHLIYTDRTKFDEVPNLDYIKDLGEIDEEQVDEFVDILPKTVDFMIK